MGRADRIVFGALGLLFLTAGSVGCIGSWGAYLLDSRIAKTGMRAEALVIEKSYASTTDGTRDFLVKYEFNQANGDQVVGEHRITYQEWTELRKGDSLQISYAADNPQRNFPVSSGATSLSLTIFLSVFSFLFLVVGGVMTMGAVGKLNRSRWFKRSEHE